MMLCRRTDVEGRQAEVAPVHKIDPVAGEVADLRGDHCPQPTPCDLRVLLSGCAKSSSKPLPGVSRPNATVRDRPPAVRSPSDGLSVGKQ